MNFSSCFYIEFLWRGKVSIPGNQTGSEQELHSCDQGCVINVSLSFHNHIWLSSQMSKLGGVWAQATQEGNIVAIKRIEHYRM